MSTKAAEPLPALLVEDDSLLALVTEDSLTTLGFAPHVVSHAAGALEAMAKGLDAQLAVIDVGLPDLRGDELARRLRADHPALRIVIATGYDTQDFKDRFAGDAAVAVLGKPFDEADLIEVLQSLGFAV